MNGTDANEDSSTERGGEDRIEAIRATLTVAILKGALRPGMKLRDDVIARHFGVSRTVARGAVAILQRERLVDRRRNHGAFVASPDTEEARQLLAARRALELTTVRLAGHAASPAALDRLENLVTAEDALRAGDAREREESLVWGNFHLELAEAAGNAVLAEFVRNVITRISLVSAMYENAGARRCGPDHHRRIIDRLRKGDMDGALETMVAHLDEMEAGMNLNGPADDQYSLAAVLEKFAPAAD